jgi:hypothetical protein
VPRAKLACGRVGDDGDGVAAHPSIPALRLLSRPAARVGRQLVQLHGAGNQSPARRGGGVHRSGSRCVMAHVPVGVGGSSCEAETCRARRRLVVRGRDLSKGVPLVGNWSEMLPIGREHDVLPESVLTGVLSLPRPESWPSRCQRCQVTLC